MEGNFTVEHALTWDASGSWTFCFWLADSSTAVATPYTQTVNFRNPTGTITASLTPAVPQPGQTTTVTITGSSEAPKRVFATIRPAGGAACAPTYDADSGRGLVSGTPVNGAFTTTTTTSQPVGSYVICLWLASSSSDTTPVAGPQSQPFDAVAPAPRVSSAGLVKCASPYRRISKVSARRTAQLCVRFRFATAPQPAARLATAFVGPTGRTVKKTRYAWPTNTTEPWVVMGPLNRSSFRSRRGSWKAVLTVDGKPITTKLFSVKR